MAKTKATKSKELSALTTYAKQAKGLVVSTFSSLTMTDMEKIRQNSRQANVVFKTAKKTLLKKVFSQLGLDQTKLDSLSGNIGVSFGLDDEIAPAKTVADFSKDKKTISIELGVLNGNLVDAIAARSLASLPNKQQLLGKLVWALKGNLQSLVTVLSGNTRGLVTVLSAIKDKKV
jgi:large subunit ribosomal protein L10